MKILYVIEHISAEGGLERILIDKMNALSEDEAFEISLLTVWKDTHAPAFPVSQRIERNCLEISCPTSSFGFFAVLSRVLSAYNSAVRRLSPDIVVYFRAVGAFLAAFSSWKGRSIFETHSARQYCNHRWLYPLMERKVDAVVCLTRGDARQYNRASRVEVIPNFTCMPSLAEAQQHRGRRHCSFIGRLCKEKDPMRLLALWRKIVGRVPGWTLDIYGGGEFEEQMKEHIRRSDLSESVVMHGFVRDVFPVYAGTDILLLTSVTEGLPMVIIEAMRCGVPVVSTDCPYGPAEVILDGRTGILVLPADDAAYVDAVCRLMQDAELRKSMGREAMECSRQYGRAEIVGRWKRLFSEL